MADDVRVYHLSPEEIAARFPRDRSESWKVNRRRNRAAGIDRFGRQLPREQGTNPRARGTNPRTAR